MPALPIMKALMTWSNFAFFTRKHHELTRTNTSKTEQTMTSVVKQDPESVGLFWEVGNPRYFRNIKEKTTSHTNHTKP